jgi:glutathionyl-hydroquinone reductase
MNYPDFKKFSLYDESIETVVTNTSSPIVETFNNQREMQLIALIEDLTEQLDKVVKEHPIEVNKDTYWRGVKIGLETAIELARTFNTNEK